MLPKTVEEALAAERIALLAEVGKMIDQIKPRTYDKAEEIPE